MTKDEVKAHNQRWLESDRPDKSWIDKHIVEQANFYGMTVEAHAKLQRMAATHQEEVEK